MAHLDRIAGAMNAWLLAFAIGLGMLDLTVLAAKSLPTLPQMQVPVPDTSAEHSAPATLSSPSAAPRG